MRPYPNVPIWMRVVDWELHNTPGKPWEEEAEQVLEQLKQKGLTWGEIAEKMKLNRDAVRNKYYRMRYEAKSLRTL